MPCDKPVEMDSKLSQFRKYTTNRNHVALSLQLACADFWLGLLFNPEDGGDIFLRSVRL
jgi:hypothetical protein